MDQINISCADIRLINIHSQNIHTIQGAINLHLFSREISYSAVGIAAFPWCGLT